MWRFLKTSVLFLTGLVIVLAAVDRWLGHRTAQRHGHGRIDWDAYQAVEQANLLGPRVTAVYLGDSVAHQLFTPGTEPRDDVRFVTSNQALSMAGQCYLLEDCTRNFSHLADVYVFYAPPSWRNNLGQVLTPDYFCGCFHQPAQIMEVLRLKRDFHLLAAHVARLTLPNIMAYNSNLRQSFEDAPNGFDGGLAPPEDRSEPLLNVLSRVWPEAPDVKVEPPDAEGRLTIPVSPVSWYFLRRMREICVARGIRIHVLSCPCPDDRRYRVPSDLLDRPILYYDHTLFKDAIHLSRESVEMVKQDYLAKYEVPL